MLTAQLYHVRGWLLAVWVCVSVSRSSQTWHSCYLLYFCSQTHFSRFFLFLFFHSVLRPQFSYFISCLSRGTHTHTRTPKTTQKLNRRRPRIFFAFIPLCTLWLLLSFVVRLMVIILYKFLEDSLVYSVHRVLRSGSGMAKRCGIHELFYSFAIRDAPSKLCARGYVHIVFCITFDAWVY